MPRFVFDTNVLINYIRGDDREAQEALMVAADLGRVFISQISILEFWSPEKWSIKEESPHLVPLWLHKLEEGEIPAGVIELRLAQLEEHQQPVPNKFILETRRERRRWRVLDENKQTVFIIEYTDNSFIFKSPDIRRNQVEEEISVLEAICYSLNIQIIPVSTRAQKYAEVIVKFCREILGKSVIPDSLIIATGLVRRAWLVTNEYNRWSRITDESQNKNLSLPKLKVIHPTQLAREEIPT